MASASSLFLKNKKMSGNHCLEYKYYTNDIHNEVFSILINDYKLYCKYELERSRGYRGAVSWRIQS